MLYTYGYAPSYDEYLADKKLNGGKAFKLGIRENYENSDGTVSRYDGGAIWTTPEEGYAYIQYLFDNPEKGDPKTKQEDWCVYAIDGTWDDVYYIDGEKFHRLKVDRQIIEKILR